VDLDCRVHDRAGDFVQFWHLFELRVSRGDGDVRRRELSTKSSLSSV
jgi:hypothetical protein